MTLTYNLRAVQNPVQVQQQLVEPTDEPEDVGELTKAHQQAAGAKGKSAPGTEGKDDSGT